MQKSRNARAANALRIYPGGQDTAIILLSASEQDTLDSLAAVFRLHDAAVTDLERGVPEAGETAGDLILGEGGDVRITVKGIGGGFMGLTLDINWGDISPPWLETVQFNGIAWLALVDTATYDRLLAEGKSADDATIPPAPVLALEVSP
jgi:hypothetical protein